jgi:hypothetical protein
MVLTHDYGFYLSSRMTLDEFTLLNEATQAEALIDHGILLPKGCTRF